jgi:hypothetical protein
MFFINMLSKSPKTMSYIVMKALKVECLFQVSSTNLFQPRPLILESHKRTEEEISSCIANFLFTLPRADKALFMFTGADKGSAQLINLHSYKVRLCGGPLVT